MDCGKPPKNKQAKNNPKPHPAYALYVGVAVYGTPQECIETTMQPAKATQINA
ncbi:MAG: hypothetical protein ACQCN4_00630 [Candidatus Bathyarchaeia archaeon]|jgi:hypothetical protein